jgi:hypothetical protein
MRLIPKRIAAAAIIAGALVAAAPVSGASAAIVPPVGLPGFSVIGGNEIGASGCVGTNRPSFGGNAGSTSNQTCGPVQSANGPSTGTIANVTGTSLIGATVLSPITVTAGSPVVGASIP